MTIARIPSRIVTSGAALSATQQRGTTPVRVQTGDRLLSDVQRAAEGSTLASRSLPFADGNLLVDVVLAAAVARDIDHKLGRKYQGWFLLRPRAAAILMSITEPAAPYQVGTALLSESLKTSKIRLISSVDATVDIWVY